MKCPACGFDNLDSQARCVRCGVFLAATAAEIPAGPPRARSRRRWRKYWYSWRRRRGFRWRLPKAASQSTPEEAFFDVEACKRAALLPLTLLPGLPQLLLRRNIRGWIFAGLGIIGILWIGFLPGSSWWLWGFAILAVAQVNSLCDLIPFGQYTLGKRLLYSSLLSFFFFFSAYSLYSFWGGRWLELQGVQLPLTYAAGELQGGDIIEVVALDTYAPGMLVLADSLIFDQRNPNAHYYMPRGQVIVDRILACGPAAVSIRNNEILLNRSRTPVALAPLHPQWEWRDQDLQLSGEQYLFLPSWYRAEAVVMPVLEKENIRGRVARIRWPWWRRTEFQ